MDLIFSNWFPLLPLRSFLHGRYLIIPGLSQAQYIVLLMYRFHLNPCLNPTELLRLTHIPSLPEVILFTPMRRCPSLLQLPSSWNSHIYVFHKTMSSKDIDKQTQEHNTRIVAECHSPSSNSPTQTEWISWMKYTPEEWCHNNTIDIQCKFTSQHQWLRSNSPNMLRKQE